MPASFFQIFKASSPKFMEVILLGAMSMYSTVRCYQKHRYFGVTFFWFCHFPYNFTVLIIYKKILDFYLQLIASYFQPTNSLCTARPWLRHIGFVLVYGPLALKTWRQDCIQLHKCTFYHLHTSPS